ncbi:MAG: hypothetical protein OJF50_001737 [Nitrospira sp.]|nr:hypothetical protein [Nitrospira sp.]
MNPPDNKTKDPESFVGGLNHRRSRSQFGSDSMMVASVW